ncbi:MAG: hypothetical protein D6791_05585 [Chloroflexi bacterium]|nr:MAG: hypothetical protein D6791_05585 [Chloroflexota bacterium]
MPLTRLLSLALTPEQERLIWLAGSIALYVVATNLVWALQPALGRVRWSSAASIPVGIIRFVFYVGIPYAALLGGVVNLKSLGLVEVPSHASLNQGVLLSISAVFLMGLIGWYYRRAVMALGKGVVPPLLSVQQLLGQPWGWVLVLIRVIYQQVHWAFYRALPFLILGDLYIGSFLGLALALLEAYASPQIRLEATEPGGIEWLVLSAGFAVMSAVLFVVTETSWLGAGAHLTAAVAWILLSQLRKSLRPRQS